MPNNKFSKIKLFQHNDHNVELYRIANSNGIELDIINYGARISSLRIPSIFGPNSHEDVVLGFASYHDYLSDTDYLSATVGRVANRINNSQFFINHQKFSLSSNEGKHHLHGGLEGFDSKLWSFVELIEDKDFFGIKLSLLSPHLDEGYPGNLKIELKFLLTKDNCLVINIDAISDSDTAVSITNHSYWNFNGHLDNYGDISNHVLRIPTELICDTDEQSIPTGIFSNVAGTQYDFRSHRQISCRVLQEGGVDKNYCFHNSIDSNCLAEIYSPRTGLGAVFSSDFPGLQCYTGNHMKKNYNGKSGRSYGPQYGICLEPQFYPNAINQHEFASPLLKANQPFQKTISVQFSNDYPIESSGG